jgi:cell division protein FtsQ
VSIDDVPVDGPAPLPKAVSAPRPPSWWRRAWPRLAAGARLVGVALFVLGAAACAAWGTKRYLATSPRFALREVSVEGNLRFSPEQVVEQASLQLGENVFRISLDDVRARLLDNPWFADASVVRRLPGKLEVRVAERPVAALAATPELYFVAPNGDLFKRVEQGEVADAPLLTGIRLDEFKDDPEGLRRLTTRMLSLATEYAQSPLGARAPLSEVHVDGDGALRTFGGRGSLSIVFGHPPFRRKLDQAFRVLAEAERNGHKPETVFLDNEAREGRVVVRLR